MPLCRLFELFPKKERTKFTQEQIDPDMSQHAEVTNHGANAPQSKKLRLMSILNNVKRGVIVRPQKVVIYGPEGVGKTTLASQCPSSVFIDTEGGTCHLDVPRIEAKSWEDIMNVIDALKTEKHDYKTVIIDTVDWAELRLIEWILANVTTEKKQRAASIEDYGFGKGYTLLKEYFSKFLMKLTDLVGVGMNVVMLGHSTLRKIDLPESGEAYDHYELKLSKGTSPLVKEWSDALLFLTFVTRVVDGKGKGGKERIILCNRSATHDAKNRHGLQDKVAMTIESLAPIFEGVPAASDANKEQKDDGMPFNQPPVNDKAEKLQELFGDFTPVMGEFFAKKKLAVNKWEDMPEAWASRAIEAPEGFKAVVNPQPTPDHAA